MNFYKRFIGDYKRDTTHLSILKHGVYGILLDVLYATEKGLPADYRSLCRICGAASPPEKRAVKAVADEFFPLDLDGLRYNKRAKMEIQKAREYAEKQRARAARRWDANAYAKAMPTHMPTHMPRQYPNDASHSHSTSKDLTNKTVPRKKRVPVDKSAGNSTAKAIGKIQKLLIKKGLKKQEQTFEETERNREIAKAVAAGDMERAKRLKGDA